MMFALPVAYVIAAVTYKSGFAPAPGVKTYMQLKAQGVPLQRAVRVSNPANHVVVFGDPTAALWTLSSGPPAYLFDESGQLIDFTLDVGDSTTFQYDYNVYSGANVDIQTLDKLFTAPEAPQQATSINNLKRAHEQSVAHGAAVPNGLTTETRSPRPGERGRSSKLDDQGDIVELPDPKDAPSRRPNTHSPRAGGGLAPTPRRDCG
jgi:hypothetical protein